MIEYLCAAFRRQLPSRRGLRAVWGGFALLGLALSGHAAQFDADAERPEVFTRGDIEITDPWAANGVGDAHSAQIFFEFRNRGRVVDHLLSAHAAIAAGPTTLRVATPVSGQMQSNATAAIEVPSGGVNLELSRNGYYIEINDLTLPLTMGKRFALELEFEHAGRMSIDVTSRFHSPKLSRRIREAAKRGDTMELKRLGKSL